MHLVSQRPSNKDRNSHVLNNNLVWGVHSVLYNIGWSQDKLTQVECFGMRNDSAFEDLPISKKSLEMSRAGSSPGPTCGLGLVLHKPKVRACAGLVFGISPQSRSLACKPGQARPGQARKSPSPQYKAQAWSESAFHRPDPACISNTHRNLVRYKKHVWNKGDIFFSWSTHYTL
jgi:hypothetical protein